MEKKRVAFIGLGVMGYPMAGHLARAGYQMTVFNRTQKKALQWCDEYGGSHAATPAQAVLGADFVFTCVGNDNDLEEVVLREDKGALYAMKPGSILVDHTTVSRSITEILSKKASALKVGFIDAPVSGGQTGAEKGSLTIMAGGEKEHFMLAKEVMSVYAQRIRLIGETGMGQLTKMVNQICIAGLVQGLSEALHFAEKAGLDIDAVIDVISKGAAQSWQMENRYQTMQAGDYDHGFAVDWMRKDLGICLQEARRNGASLPVTALVDQFYASIQKMGGGRWDTSSLMALLQNDVDCHNK